MPNGGKALSLTEFAWSGAYLIGAPLTGWLIGRQGWPAPFLWLGLAGIPAAVLLWRVLPPAGKAVRKPLSLANIWQVTRRHPVIWAAALYMMIPVCRSR